MLLLLLLLLLIQMKEYLFVQQCPCFDRIRCWCERLLGCIGRKRMIHLCRGRTDHFAFRLFVQMSFDRTRPLVSHVELPVGKRDGTGRTFDFARMNTLMPAEIR